MRKKRAPNGLESAGVREAPATSAGGRNWKSLGELAGSLVRDVIKKGR